MESINTNKDYQNYVDKKSPNSPIFKNCFNIVCEPLFKTFIRFN